MGKCRFGDDLKQDAVAQIAERVYPVARVAQRLDVSQNSFYAWKKKYSKASDPDRYDNETDIRRLKRELARVTEERDPLKRDFAYFVMDAQ